MSNEERIAVGLEKNADLLSQILEKLSTSPITSGLIDKKEASTLLGFKDSVGRKHLEFLRYKLGILSKPNGAPTKYYLSELLIIKDKLRAGEIALPKTYNKA